MAPDYPIFVDYPVRPSPNDQDRQMKMHRIPFTGLLKWDSLPIPTMTIPSMGFASAPMRVAGCGSRVDIPRSNTASR